MTTRNSSKSAIASVLSLAGTLFGAIGSLIVLNTMLDLHLRLMRQALPQDNVTGIVVLAIGVSLYGIGRLLLKRRSG